MGVLRFIDQAGVHGLAALLNRAAGEVRSAGRNCLVDLAVLGGSAGAAQQLLPLAAALDVAASDLRRRRIEIMPASFEGKPASPSIDPRPVRLHGFEGSSDRWGTSPIHDGSDRVRASLLEEEWGAVLAVRRADCEGVLGTFSASAIAAEGQAMGWLGVDDWGIELGFQAGTGLHLVQLDYGLDTRYLDVETEAFIGGEASVGVDLDVSDGEGSFEGELDAFIGMATAAELGVGPPAARIIGGGEIGIGLGVDVDAALGYAGGVLEFDFGASAFLGVGGGFDLSFDVDLGAIGTATLDLIDGAASWIGSLWR